MNTTSVDSPTESQLPANPAVPPPRELHESNYVPGELSLTRFRLGSLMLTIGLVAVCLAACRVSLWLGALLLLVSTPAFLRTAVEAARREAAHDVMSPGAKVVEFLRFFAITLVSGTMWLSFVATLGAATFVAAGAVSTATGDTGSLTILCFLTGLLTTIALSLLVGVCLIREIWK